MDETGPKLTNEARLLDALETIWGKSISVKSDYARAHADVIAMAASLQLITTKIGPSKFASAWHITSLGVSWIQLNK